MHATRYLAALGLTSSMAMADDYDQAVRAYAVCLLPETLAIQLFQTCDQPDDKQLTAGIMRLSMPNGAFDLTCGEELNHAMNLASSEENRELVHHDADVVLHALRVEFYATYGPIPDDADAKMAFACMIRDHEVAKSSAVGQLYRQLIE